MILLHFAPPPRPRAIEVLARLPLAFELNAGQVDPVVRFIARGAGHAVFLTAAETVLFVDRHASQRPVRMRLEGGNPDSEADGIDRLPGVANYFTGADPGRWTANLPLFARVRYREVYPGVDAVFHGSSGLLEYDFIVRPGADPAAVRLGFEGVRRISLSPAGDLLLAAEGGLIRQRKPVIYQDFDGRRRIVRGGYSLLAENRVGFRIGSYDPARPLVIDPVLVYSTYLGGAGDELGQDIAVDSAGSAYIIGRTNSPGFPTTAGSVSQASRGTDVFVAKLSPAGNTLVYSTYLGGSGGEVGRGIAVDSAGNAYVTGDTLSTDFPLVGPIQTSARNREVFVAKLNPAGSALSYSTYLGGAGQEVGHAIAVDSAGSAYVAGVTDSADFPLLNPIQSAYGGNQDAFVAKLAPDGGALAYATFLGGAAGEVAYGIAVDSAGAAYVGGLTGSNAFPIVNALQRTRLGALEGFVAKLNPSGSALVYSTYLGGADNDQVSRLALGPDGSVFLAGVTRSANFPIVNPARGANAGLEDGFAAKLSPSGSALLYSTYLGGAAVDAALGIAVDASGSAFVTGVTSSDNFPSLGTTQSRRNTDAFLTQFSPAGAIVFSTWLGGDGSENGNAVAVDRNGAAYVAGVTDSSDFPLLKPLQSTYGGRATAGLGDAFILKLAADEAPLGQLSLYNAASLSGPALAPDSMATAKGPGLAPATAIADSTAPPESLEGVTVTITDSAGVDHACRIFFVSPGQINFAVPAQTAAGPARVQVKLGDRIVAAGPATIETVSPGIFAANGNGAGVAAALALRIAADGGQSSSLVFQCPASGACAPSAIDLGSDADQVFLLLFGTGIRAYSRIAATVGGEPADVAGAAAQGQYPGFDQVNLRLSRSLIGRGEASVVVTADGKAANPVAIRIGGSAPQPPPGITSLDPSSSSPNRTIAEFTIKGTALTGVTAVEFSPPAGISVSGVSAAAGAVTARVAIAADASLGERQVTVVSPRGRSNPLPFSLVAAGPPAIEFLSPASAQRGQTVELKVFGTNLDNVSAIEFSPPQGISAGKLRIFDDTYLTVEVTVAADAPPGARQVTAVSPAGRSNNRSFNVGLGPAEFLPLGTGMQWTYRVTVPATTALPYQPVSDNPNFLCSNIACGSVTWQAGTYNLSVTVGNRLSNSGLFDESFRATLAESGPRFYFGTATATTPIELSATSGEDSRTGEPFTRMDILAEFGPAVRFFRQLAVVTQSSLARVESVTVPAGTYPNAVRVSLTLTGNGIHVSGTFTTDVWMAPNVGIVRAVMRNASSTVLYTQELTQFTRP